MAIIKINNRLKFVNRITEFKKVRPGVYEGKANGRAFVIDGGRACGGSRKDWFLVWEGFCSDKPLYCNSVCDAVNLLETC